MSRENQYEAKLKINGEDFGVWDSLEGGEVDSEETKYSPGGMADQISLGGRKQTGNVTLSRLYRMDTDSRVVKQLMELAGNGSCVATKQGLDSAGNAVGEALTYKGTLKRVTPPTHNSESDDPGLIEIEISVAGQPV